ncbi:Uncharacterized protein dnm_032360 [Desulfonema magnum]|uniref:Uncharacterized protein n=1 Tax=Desulfonema magnum TaxID=45655 RepID=A0A975GMR0_9BACT|nr:Uncharacterized protein dnm_032360 [Desulfonema magnum]
MKSNSGLFFATKTRRLTKSLCAFVALRACLKCNFPCVSCVSQLKKIARLVFGDICYFSNTL